MNEYNLWLSTMWTDVFVYFWKPFYKGPENWLVDGEDNSIQIAAQQTVEEHMPEVYNYVKPIIIVQN